MIETLTSAVIVLAISLVGLALLYSVLLSDHSRRIERIRKDVDLNGIDRSINDLADKVETFTVEVEEVVDEDTKLPKSLAIFEHNGKLYSEMHGNKNINDILKMDIKVKSSSTKTIHMVNDDGTHTLIWRDGGLIE